MKKTEKGRKEPDRRTMKIETGSTSQLVEMNPFCLHQNENTGSIIIMRKKMDEIILFDISDMVETQTIVNDSR